VIINSFCQILRERKLSKSVFISHAVRDRALVQEIVSLIEEGMGVPEEEIFCSSLNGYGIPNGKNFVTYIKEQLLEPKVVVLVLTPSYFVSKFCLSELGAAWIKSHDISSVQKILPFYRI
jgi:TIR domain